MVGKIANGVIFVAVIGVTIGARTFAKLHLGPVFILEVLFLIWTLSVLLSDGPRGALKKIAVRPLLLYIPFFVYSVCIFFSGLHSWSGEPPLRRIIQHALLFIYPLLWIPVGAWAARSQSPNERRGLMLSLVIANMVSYLFFIYSDFEANQGVEFLYSNLAIGPLAGAMSVILYERKRVFAAFFVYLVSILPFMIMIQGRMQRSAFALLLFSFILAPVIVSSGRKFLRALGLSAFAIGLSLALLWLSLFQSSLKRPDQKPPLSLAIDSLRHNDDYPAPSEAQQQPASGVSFTFASRRFWWRTALSDWSKNPLLGTGFVPEVPSQINPGVPNDGHFEKYPAYKILGNTAISGPHNSYLSVLARTGVVGTLLFSVFLISVLFGVARFVVSANQFDVISRVCAILVVLNGLLYAVVGIGFESPHNSVLLWFFSGFIAASTESRKQSL